MRKEALLYYWDAVNSVTHSLKAPFSNQWGIDNATSFAPYKIGCDEVVVFNVKNETIVAINGSDKDREEWRGNFDGYPITDGCHNNFRSDGIKILETVLRDCPVFTPITVVGHSRGGALAQIFAHYAQALHGRKALAITYGSPRCFTVAKTRSLSFYHVRVHTNGDPVPHIPMCWLPPFFKSYQTTDAKIRTRRILGVRKKHGEYGEMIRRYMK